MSPESRWAICFALGSPHSGPGARRKVDGQEAPGPSGLSRRDGEGAGPTVVGSDSSGPGALRRHAGGLLDAGYGHVTYFVGAARTAARDGRGIVAAVGGMSNKFKEHSLSTGGSVMR